MSSVITKTVRASDLSRDSAAVFRAADTGAVQVNRRDAEPLVLTRKSEFEQQTTVLNLAADLVAASLGSDDQPFTERLLARFPWMTFLTEAERAQFGEEMVAVTRSCAAAREFTPFLAELSAWHSTAAAKAAGYAQVDDLDWYDSPVPVPDPRAA